MNNRDVAKELVKIAKLLCAANIVEENGILYVGPYSAIEHVYSKMKTYGVWNSAKKAIEINLSSLTPVKRKNLDKLLDSLREKEKDTVIESEKLVEEIKNLPYYPVEEYHDKSGFSLGGDTYPIQKTIKDAGGSWNGSTRKYDFNKASIKIENFKKLIELLKKENDAKAEGRRKKDEVLKEIHNKKWANLGVSFEHKGVDLLIYGITIENKHLIKDKFEKPTWNSGHWVIDTRLESSSNFKSRIEELVKKLDEMEIETAKKQPEITAIPQHQCRPNKKGGECRICGGYVEVGEGCIERIYDELEAERRGWNPETEGFVWVVYHKDKRVCEEVKKKQKELAEIHHNKAKAKSKIREIATKGTRPSGENRPQGKEIMLDNTAIAYGGGSWVVIEPDEKYMWYIQNNGGDGDDWSHNNVITGGAGAIGWRVEYTEELKQLIEIATK